MWHFRKSCRRALCERSVTDTMTNHYSFQVTQPRHFPAIIIIAAILAIPASCSRPSDDKELCDPVSDSLRTTDSSRLVSGSYRLVIVATNGARSGAKVQGTLTLRPTLGTDRSPESGRQPRANENRASTPLWGYIDADLASVGAPLPDSGNPDEPGASSRDPVFPGVLVHVQNWGEPSLRQQFMLTVATSFNARVDLGYVRMDGPGFIMNVREITARGFRGTWNQGGRIVAEGYFCAFLGSYRRSSIPMDGTPQGSEQGLAVHR